MRSVAPSSAVAQATVSKVEPWKVGLAAITLPAADRQKEVDSRAVRLFGERQAIGPARAPALRQGRRRARGGAVRAKQPDLQRIGAPHGHAVGLGGRAMGQGAGLREQTAAQSSPAASPGLDATPFGQTSAASTRERRLGAGGCPERSRQAIRDDREEIGMSRPRSATSVGRGWAFIALAVLAGAWIVNKSGEGALEARTRRRLAPPGESPRGGR